MKRPVGKFGRYMMAAVAALLMLAVIPAMAEDKSGGVTTDRGHRPTTDDRVGDSNGANNGNSNSDNSDKSSTDTPRRPERPHTSTDDDLSPLNDNVGQPSSGNTLPPTTSTQTPNFDIRQVPEPATLLLTGTAFLFLARKLRK